MRLPSWYARWDISPLQVPTWLLPAALDLVAFMAIWTGLAGQRSERAREPVRVIRRAAKRMPSEPTFRRTTTPTSFPSTQRNGEMGRGSLTGAPLRRPRATPWA
jgi:hypothetical protein